MPVDRKALTDAIAEAVTKAIPQNSIGASAGAALYAAVGFLVHEIEALEKKLETSPFRFVGPFSEGMTYEKGNFIVFGGSLWHCNSTTRDRPGTSYDWTLCCKKGADGRDLR